MSLRFTAIKEVATNRKETIETPSIKVSTIFGENVFTLTTAREYLSDEAYKSLQASIKGSKKIDRAVANQ